MMTTRSTVGISSATPRPAVDQVLLDALDDGAELDADPLVGADDEPAAVGGRSADQSAMGGARRGRPDLGEGVGFDHARHGRGHQALQAVRRRRLQELQRVGGTRRQPERGDALEHARGDLRRSRPAR